MVFHARDDDVITSAGYRIGPVEIEQALTTIPTWSWPPWWGARPVRTEIVVAHVVLRDGAIWDGPARGVAGSGAREGVGPLRAATRDPRRKPAVTATGKILRRALRGGA
jgi:acetyl-CoA synthetase